MRLFLFTNGDRHAAGSTLSGKAPGESDRLATDHLEEVTLD